MSQACTAQEEQVKIKDNIIFDYKKKVTDVESRLKQQQVHISVTQTICTTATHTAHLESV
jgi:hypothetical protein